jgi:hypothetical protein
MIDFFHHVSLAGQLLSYLSIPRFPGERPVSLVSMIDFFRHRSLAEQLLADLSFPVVVGIFVSAKTSGQRYAVDEKRWQRHAKYAIATGFVVMITLTIYCHIS